MTHLGGRGSEVNWGAQRYKGEIEEIEETARERERETERRRARQREGQREGQREQRKTERDRERSLGIRERQRDLISLSREIKRDRVVPDT